MWSVCATMKTLYQPTWPNVSLGHASRLARRKAGGVGQLGRAATQSVARTARGGHARGAGRSWLEVVAVFSCRVWFMCPSGLPGQRNSSLGGSFADQVPLDDGPRDASGSRTPRE